MRTDEELRDAAFLALRDALGPRDALRFVRFYRPEPGDFTEEKYLHLGDPTLEELVARIEQSRSGKRPDPSPSGPDRSDDEVLQIGYVALREVLGAEEGLRFIRLYDPPVGDRAEDFFLNGKAVSDPMKTARPKPVGQGQAA